MKNIIIYKVLVFLAAVVLLSACTEKTADVRLDPQITTSQVLSIKSDGATVIGFIVAAGDGFSERGVCYDKAATPTIEKSKTPYNGQRSTATFEVKLTGLTFATKYYARAYVINENGPIYGEEVNFTTLPVVGTITTTAAGSITGTTAVTGGNITADGGSAITARGVCYGTSHNPTIAGSKTSDGSGTGIFTSNLSGLSGLTTYYVRAYATNSAGTVYGNEISFTTLVSVRNWNVPGNYVAASYPIAGFADWSPAQSPKVKSKESAPDNVEGYVYMSLTSNSFKFATKDNWDGPNYGAGSTAGTLDAAGGDISLPAGYYKFNINAGANPMTYTAIATTWGVIGDGTPGGWGSQTNMTYLPSSQIFGLGLHMTTGGYFKFRGTSDWSVNYGAPAGSSALVAGGDNIAVTVTDDYAITLDLSHPLEYTYSANRWGIIGNATPGGWSSDQNMAWDAVDGVFKATIDLTVGEMKFRANDDWAVNLGGSLGALTQDGANIQVTTPGNYTITLNPWTRVATMTMN
jgi:starch-binding outer membrane protein SusE/F